MASKSFFEVLEQQIRTDLRAEIEAEVRNQYAQQAAKSPAGTQAARARLNTWIATAAEQRVHTPRTSAHKAYSSGNASQSKTASNKTSAKNETPRSKIPKAASPETPISDVEIKVQQPDLLVALEILNRYSGSELGESITRTALNRAWRKAAFATHPDRFGQNDAISQSRAKALFCELAKAFDSLEALFKQTT
jgi:curved DNA-binding protein CbpA